LTHELGRLTGVTGFELTSRHDNRGNTELLEDQVRLESLTLTLTTPHAENERHLDLRQFHVVLGNVHNHLIHEGRGDVEVLRGDVVVLGVRLHTRGQVISGGHGGVVGTAEAGRALKLRVNHAAAAGDVLLVVRDVFIHSLPAGHFNLGAVGDGGNAGTEEGLRRDGALRRNVGLLKDKTKGRIIGSVDPFSRHRKTSSPHPRRMRRSTPEKSKEKKHAL